MIHKLLDTYADEEQHYQLTTHPKITYDWLTEAFVVELDDMNWCEVFGANRFEHAIKIADIFKE